MIRTIYALLFLVFCAAGLPLQAAERILSFDSDIVVLQSGALDVTETIRVRAEGRDIKRGIFRDIPTDYEDRYGNRFRSGFELLSVMRDGQFEDSHTQTQSNGIRIYIGNKDRYLKTGEYEYRIRYRMTRQLGFFEEHDELYWNVTGTGWIFPIDSVTATITLPGIPANAMSTEAYTGAQGAKGQDYVSRIDVMGRAVFETSRALSAHQGLTIVVTWPKGYVIEPTALDNFRYLLKDNRPLLFGIAGLSILLLYYLLVWHHFGRDPQAGVVFPLYHPPKGYSPASMRFVERMGYDHKCFASALINLAVKGYLKIDDEKGDDWLIQKTGNEVEMAPGEAALVKRLFASGDFIILKQENHSRISRAIKAHKRSLRRNYESIYFLTNKLFLVPGILISIALIYATALSQPLTEEIGVSLFMSIWLTGWSLGTFAMCYAAWRAWQGARAGGSSSRALGLSFFALPFLFFWFVGVTVLFETTGIGFPLILLLTVAINVAFYQWLKAPTRAGRKLLDKVEGFRQYIEVAEADEMADKQKLQDLTLFERYLPYALALDVEQAWAERFADTMKKMEKEGKPYQPGWYHGRGWSHFSPSSFASSLGTGLSSAIASSAQAPGSSSGSGGGGFSGGGGGGGGGGGW